ncbi:MAG: FAD-dependent oxidoreductase [Candidatus Lernaella stagnicola]|nr:FAD-dependent oxidoreductase [Candidatus Lernaella stagnicola]
MGKVAFGCWSDRLIDHRGKAPVEAPDDLKLPFTYREPDDIKAFIGWDGFFIADESVNVVALCCAYMEAAQSEASCGECFPCRVGTHIAAELLQKLCEGNATAEDLQQLRDVLVSVANASKCQIGQTVPRPVLKALEHYADTFNACVGSGRRIEPVELLTRMAAPCTEACPAHLDIPLYVENIKKRRYLESSDVARANCVMPAVLGRVCVRPCESHCRRANVDEAIQIKDLKRFASDYEMLHGHRPGGRVLQPPTGKKVAVLGAGPAGLAASEKLAQMGHAVTIYEALAEGGGMAAVGIPDYRLPRAVLRREVELIQELGVDILYQQRIGENGPAWDDLLHKLGYDAVFIGVGAHHSNKLRCEGEDEGYKGFIHGVHFLRAVAEGKETPEGKKIVVVGGGNVAIDCVRTAMRLGFEDVNIVYRRTEKEMPADDVEIRDAHEERVTFNFLCNPTKLIADDEGRLTAIELIRMELGEPDASGRRRPVPMEGSEFMMEVDVVIPAIGQSPDLGFLAKAEGLEFTRWNTVVADEYTGATALPNVFAGGDCVTGAATLIEAVAAGNRAAISIDRFLRGEIVDLDHYQRMERVLASVKTYDPDEVINLPEGMHRRGFDHLPVETRITNFDEVEAVMSARNATTEAARCLRCYRLVGVAL